MPLPFHPARARPLWLVCACACPLVLAGAAPQDHSGERAAQNNELFRQALKERAREMDPAEAGIGERFADLAFEDYLGRPGRLSDYADGGVLVIAVRQIGCPVGGRYGPRLARLEREYAERGVAFLYVNEDKFLEPEEVERDEYEAYGFTGRYVHDPGEVFGRAFGFETTTAVFVLDAARTLRYRGAVDDQYGRGVILPEPRHELLKNALDSVLAGEEVALPATTAPGCMLGIEREPAGRAGEVTFHREVARILQRNCVECHHADGPAPFALEDYETAFDKRRMIGMVVDKRIMPPWYASPESGPWRNDRRLSEAERATLLEWIAADAPEGDPADAPVPLVWKKGWLIGEPDETFQLAHAVDVPAEGAVDYVYIEADRLVPRDMWVEALQVIPGEPAVVHHCSVEFRAPPDYGRSGRTRLMDTLVPWNKPAPRWEYLFGYLPGKGPRTYREGVVRFLPAGSHIRFGLHYTPSGEATTDRTTLGLVETRSEPRFLAESRYMHNKDIAIAPGAQGVYSAELLITKQAILRSLSPHMHLRGRTFVAEMKEPGDDDWREILRLPEWDQDWQLSYVFADEPIVPRGTRIRMTGHYDNSAVNPNNPDPTQWVYFGEQTWDEMLTMAVEWIRPIDAP